MHGHVNTSAGTSQRLRKANGHFVNAPLHRLDDKSADSKVNGGDQDEEYVALNDDDLRVTLPDSQSRYAFIYYNSTT
jgi:hypothetical protein